MWEKDGSDIQRLWNLIVEFLIIEFQNRSISDPSLSDIDFKNKMALGWTTLNIVYVIKYVSDCQQYVTHSYLIRYAHSEFATLWWLILIQFEILCSMKPILLFKTVQHFPINWSLIYSCHPSQDLNRFFPSALPPEPSYNCFQIFIAINKCNQLVIDNHWYLENFPWRFWNEKIVSR